MSLILELENSKNLIKRLKELDKFKHSSSVEEGEIETLQEFIKEWEDYHPKTYYPNYKKTMKKNAMDLSEYKDIMEVIARLKLENEKLDKIEERFKKFNIPKRYQNGQKQPLGDYKERLQEFMEMTWREESKKKREKE
ncbi:hypothetical protein CsatB_002026 [Cannabis sativa]